MMWIPTCYHSGNSRHAQTLVEPKVFGQEIISIVSPEFSTLADGTMVGQARYPADSLHRRVRLFNARVLGHNTSAWRL
jgi:hypothetical protein